MTKRSAKTASCAVTIILCLALFAGAAWSEEPWRQSFDETCAKTDQAMTLSVDELSTLVQRCDELRKVIETQEESLRKVYLKRLQLCRNLYSYVLDYKKNALSSK